MNGCVIIWTEPTPKVVFSYDNFGMTNCRCHLVGQERYDRDSWEEKIVSQILNRFCGQRHL